MHRPARPARLAHHGRHARTLVGHGGHGGHAGRLAAPAAPAPPRHGVAAAGLAVALAGLAAPSATADLVENVWFGPEDYAFRFTHMPDIDQLRMSQAIPQIIGLPNDGVAYCVPTSVFNLSAYATDHGYENAFLPEYWQGQEAYPTITTYVDLLGDWGFTDAELGTSLSGTRLMLESVFSPARFTVTVEGAGLFWAPKVRDLAQMVRNGGIVGLGHGWYVPDGENLVVRDGGHWLTFTRAYHDVFTQELWVRDSADSPADFVQSTFTERVYSFEDSIYATQNDGIKLMSRIMTGPDDPVIRLIDAYCMVKPRFAATFDDSEPRISITWAGPFLGAPQPETILADSPGQIASAEIGPLQSRLYAAIQTAAGGSALYCLDLQDPEWIQLPIPVPPNPFLELANDRSLLVVGDGEAQRILLDAEVPDVIAAIDVPEDAVVDFDRFTAHLVALSPSARELFLYPQDLSGLVQSLTIPGDEPFAPGTSISWDETRGALWVLDPGDAPGTARLVTPIPGTPVTDVIEAEFPGLIDPEIIVADDAGRILIVDDGRWKVFREGDDGAWIRDDDAPFDGVPADRRSLVSESRTYEDPELHDPERWRNVLPESFAAPVLDCPADIDLDRVVGFPDLLAVLAEFGPCTPGDSCETDLDGDFTTGFGDVLTLLSAWGDCR